MTETNIALADFKISPIGFSSHEKATIETFFRLASHRAPHWTVTTFVREARVMLFNASSQQDVDAFKSEVSPWQQVVIVGASDFGTGWAVISRPLKLTVILNVLNEVLKTVTPAKFSAKSLSIQAHAPINTVSNSVAASPLVADLYASKPEPEPVTYGLNEAPSFTVPTSKKSFLGSAPRKDVSAVLGRVLIVDDSEIALKYMHNRLIYFGYECELARSGEEAVALIGKNNYHFVFLDVTMAGMDGYKTCRAIKSYTARHGSVPVVVMVTSRGGTIDKIRGAMAGCDAYLTKPLNEKELSLVLSKYDDSTAIQRWEAVHPREPLVDKYATNL